MREREDRGVAAQARQLKRGGAAHARETRGRLRGRSFGEVICALFEDDTQDVPLFAR